jgi:hypothetical protein
MASAPDDDVFDQFLERRGHEPTESWDRSYNKKQCPDCGGLHELSASRCTVCGWQAPDAGTDVGAD